MKVIFITREGYDLAGARVRCYNFSRELRSHGLDTEVLSFRDTLGAKDGKEESQMGIRDRVRFNCRAFQMLCKDKNAVLYIQRFNYHSFAPYLANFIRKNKIILDLDDWEMRENPEYFFKFYPTSKAHYFTRQIARKSIFCVAASRFLEDFLSSYNQRVYYIPSGVDTELFNFNLNGAKQDRVVFSWIGTFHKTEYIENIMFALECFSVLRKDNSNIYFDIVGDGIYKNDLMKLIARFDDPHVQLKGWIPPDKIPQYLATIHIGLLPVVSDSKFNKAKSSTKLFEYMAMAKPTVSSGIGEANEIIQDGVNGLLAMTKVEFAKKMQVLIKDPLLRTRLGDSARQSIEMKYSLKVLGRQLYDILKPNLC